MVVVDTHTRKVQKAREITRVHDLGQTCCKQELLIDDDTASI